MLANMKTNTVADKKTPSYKMFDRQKEEKKQGQNGSQKAAKNVMNANINNGTWKKLGTCSSIT